MSSVRIHALLLALLGILAMSTTLPAYAPTTSPLVASDVANAYSSIATVGGQNLLEDAFGKHIVVYPDTSGSLSISWANTDPTEPGAWSPPQKSALPASPYLRPSAILVSQSTLRVIAEGGTGPGHIVDVEVDLGRDLFGNIQLASFAPPVTLDLTGQYPTAIQLFDGSIVTVWNSREIGVHSSVKSMRWSGFDGWRSLSDPSSAVPDNVIRDTNNTSPIFPNIIQRPDDLNLLVVGNRGTSSLATNLVYNTATYGLFSWEWGVQDLNFETNAARGLPDTPDMVWDPKESRVIIAYDISGAAQYGIIILDSSNTKLHLDTPSLNMTNNEWGTIQVGRRSGELYLFTINTRVGDDFGSLGYVRYSNGQWDTALTIVDPGTDNMGISVKRTTRLGPATALLPPGLENSIDLLYAKGTTAPSTLLLARVRPT